ncbi:MAG: hypothetical protein ACRDI2_21720, partial [Chloroflexota bacterium]
MPIIYRTGDGPKMLTPRVYAAEKELEDEIAQHPELVMVDGEPAVALVKRQVEIPGAGPADVLLVDAEGQPIVVEVKLAKNADMRRLVAAQILDYVSALAQLNVYELDGLVGGSLEAALRSIDEGADAADADFDRRWRACSAKL